MLIYRFFAGRVFIFLDPEREMCYDNEKNSLDGKMEDARK